MFPQGRQTTSSVGGSLTATGRIMLIIYAAVYVVELLGEHWLGLPLYRWLALSPPGSGFFHLWQLVTHPVIHDPTAPIGFLIDCVVFYFFAGTIESALGTRRFLRLYLIATAGAAVAGLLFSRLVGGGVPFAGMMPGLLALIVVFGLLQPEATVLLLFVLPVKAKTISYGTAIVTALTFLARTNPHGAYHLGAIAFAWFSYRPPTRLFDPDWWRWKFFSLAQRRQRSRFTVIDGEKRDDDGKPTIH